MNTKELEKSINEILEDCEEQGLIVASGAKGLVMGTNTKVAATLDYIIFNYLKNNKKDLNNKAEILKKFIDFVVEANCDKDKLEELLTKDNLKQLKDIFEELFKTIK